MKALEAAGKKTELAIITCRPEDPTGYGRIVRNKKNKVEAIIEQLDATPAQRKIEEINAGIYIAEVPQVFKSLERVRKKNAQGEYYLTDLVEEARSRNKKVLAVERENYKGLMGINSRLELAVVQKEMNRRLLEKLMDHGVAVEDPDRTFVGPDVKIGKDCVIKPDCYFSGRVVIGKDSIVGPGAVLHNVQAGKNVQIKAWSVLENCVLADGVIAGPFVRLRPGAELLKNSRAGNFVEIKKSTLGKGSKANHLSYIGDATVGDGVNVGAGTITCNYDGVNKHQTIIENGVFIGSDTQLVAPVCIGKNAVIGAGTTVTKDVPADALAVSRTNQKNIPKYGKRRKKRTKKK